MAGFFTCPEESVTSNINVQTCFERSMYDISLGFLISITFCKGTDSRPKPVTVYAHVHAQFEIETDISDKMAEVSIASQNFGHKTKGIKIFCFYRQSHERQYGGYPDKI
ncbi:hypothetical protein KUTeg_014028 [Tegillarca granosa]|uniref:Uncharacterized protein n=1 Tax=Tegillarca granosa TaxID=220873 RepID=A0ABQ9EVE9_TEGGR|nr:hypothetical protein KUTeg_014028 [Tegillarca granosa]